jgi:hypothetical protein
MRLHPAIVAVPALALLAGCVREETAPQRTSQVIVQPQQPATVATPAAERAGSNAARRRRTGGLAAGSLAAQQQQLGLAARPVCAATAGPDHLGSGPLDAAARRRLGVAGGALGLMW